MVFKSWLCNCRTGDHFGMFVLWRKTWNWRVRSLHLAEKKRQNHASISSFFLEIVLFSCRVWNKGKVYDVHHLLSTLFCFVGPRDRDYPIGSNFWKLYLIKINFMLSKLVSLVQMFKLFRLEGSFLGIQSLNTVSRCTTSYLLAGPAACLWCLVLFAPLSSIDSCLVLSCHVTKSFSHDTYAPSHQICWNVSFISLWESSVFITIYHLGRSLKRGQCLCSAHEVLCKVGQIMWVEVLDLTQKKTPMQYGGSWN
jgi:hypothetical protein